MGDIATVGLNETDQTKQNFAIRQHAERILGHADRILRLERARFYVTDYGAKGDNATDDSAAVQSCINAAGAVAGDVVFPRTGGSYVLGGTSLTINSTSCPNGITITGSGKYLPCIAVTNPSRVLFGITTNNVTFRDLNITGYGTPTGGDIVMLAAGNSFTVENTAIVNFSWGIIIQSTVSNHSLRDIFMSQIHTVGIQLDGGAASIGNIDNFVILHGGVSCYAGIQFIGGGSCCISNCQITGTGIGRGMDFAPTGTPSNPGIVASVKITNTYLDNCVIGMACEPDANSVVQRITFIGGWISSSAIIGVSLTRNTQSIIFDGTEFYDNTGGAITAYASTVDGLQVKDCIFAGNKTAPCVVLAAGVSGFAINDNMFGPYGGFVTNYSNVFVATGASDYYTIQGNIFNPGTSSSLFDGGTGTHKSVVNNAG